MKTASLQIFNAFKAPHFTLPGLFTLAYLDIGHVFREALILLADLKSQLPSVTHHEHRHLGPGE